MDTHDRMERQPPPYPETSDVSTSSLDKQAEAPAPAAQHLEAIRTISRVPGNSHYYEKDGLRTYGDNEDHDHEPKVSAKCL